MKLIYLKLHFSIKQTISISKLNLLVNVGKKLKKCYIWGTGQAVAQLVEALRYKPEGRGFDIRWRH